MEKDFFVKQLKEAYATHQKYFWITRKIKAHPESLSLLKQLTSFLDHYYDNVSLQQRYWHIIHETQEIPRCSCGRLLAFTDLNKGGYRKSCNRKSCKALAMKKTNLKKYGTSSVMQVSHIKSKRKKTIQEKYGVDEIFQLESIREVRDLKLKQRKIQYLDKTVGANNYKLLDDKTLDYHCDKCHKTSILPIQWVYHQRYDLCQYCSPKNSSTSFYEKEILDWLKSMNLECHQNTKSILDGLEIDIYLPHYRLGIEFNGIYWHSSLFKEKKYHLNKFELAQNKNINLIQIWQDLWNTKKEIYKSIILSKIKPQHRIYARQTFVQEISTQEARDFCQKNHLHGYVNSNVKLGLYYNQTLVSVMTLGRRSIGRKRSSEVEILRYCCLLNHQILGGASKLLKFYLQKYPETSEIITFSYNDLGLNKIYPKLGFENSGRSLSYFYFKDGQRYSRYSFQKRKLLQKYGSDLENLSEFEIMRNNKYLFCYDSGTTKWILKRKAN